MDPQEDNRASQMIEGVENASEIVKKDADATEKEVASAREEGPGIHLGISPGDGRLHDGQQALCLRKAHSGTIA